MKRLKLILLAGVLSSVLGGCLVSGTVRTRAYVEPELVYVSPGVQVVYDYNEPVFYSEGYYWRYDGGIWYRSGYYNRGWVRWRNVPVAVGRIDRPHAYVHYRGSAGARRERARVREHRRDDRREIRQERREERRDKVQDKRERKQEKRRDKNEDRGRVKVRDHR